MIWLIIFFAILIILFIPFKAKSKVFYDLIKNEGKILFSIFGIVCINDDFNLSFYSITIKGKNAEKKMPYKDFGKSSFTDIFAMNLLKSIKVNSIKSELFVGFSDYVCETSLLAGLLLNIQNIFLGYLSNCRDIKVLKSKVFATYTKDTIGAHFSFSVTLNLYIIFVCLFNALFKIERGVKIYAGKSS